LTKINPKAWAIAVAVLLISSTLLALYLFNGAPIPDKDLSTANIKPQTPHYLAYSSGNESKIFLLSDDPTYGYWTQNDTHMDWFTNGPIIHKGDPVFIINATIRNDYTQNDQNKVNGDKFSWVVFNIVLYDKTGTVIDALQAYPQVDTRLNGHIFTFNTGETASYGVFMATGNRQIDHYEILVATVSSMPPPS
jgi:hypothetical protein